MNSILFTATSWISSIKSQSQIRNCITSFEFSFCGLVPRIGDLMPVVAKKYKMVRFFLRFRPAFLHHHLLLFMHQGFMQLLLTCQTFLKGRIFRFLLDNGGLIGGICQHLHIQFLRLNNQAWLFWKNYRFFLPRWIKLLLILERLWIVISLNKFLLLEVFGLK